MVKSHKIIDLSNIESRGSNHYVCIAIFKENLPLCNKTLDYHIYNLKKPHWWHLYENDKIQGEQGTSVSCYYFS